METHFFSSKPNQILGSLVLVMIVVALGAYANFTFNQAKYTNGNMPATISVTGEGEVLAVPDIGTFSFSVEAEADTAAAAQEESGTKINTILAYLQEQGIEEKDIKTQNYNLYPQYRYEERICPTNSYCPPGERVQDGFSVTQSVTVKVRNTDEAGAIIAGVGERGATNISGLNFTIDDTDVLKEEARAKAIVDAKKKAKKLADDLGVRIVRMVGYSEEEGRYYEPRLQYFSADAAVEEAGFGGADLPVGENSTTARVNITYEVK